MLRDESGFGSEGVTVASDRRKVWRWGNVLAPVFVVAVSVGILGSEAAPSASAGAYLMAFSIGICGALLCAYLPCIYWYFFTASHAYKITADKLQVWSRGKIIKELELSEIVRFRIRGRVSGWTFILTPSTWLSWPRGHVTIRTGAGDLETVRLPEMILWGDSVYEAEKLVMDHLASAK
jgi:hypothetical protein